MKTHKINCHVNLGAPTEDCNCGAVQTNECIEDYVKMRKLDNPFNSNHVFKKEDMNRTKLTWKDKLRVFHKKTYVQIGDGYVYRYKIGNDGTYYLFDFRPYK